MRVARREPVERTPVWFMRQAGRSLPEYRALRERHCFFEIAGTPELCAEVTLQPVRRHGVDAAVLFADICHARARDGHRRRARRGCRPGRGRADREPRRRGATARDRAGRRGANPRGDPHRAAELDEERAVIGFCGAPFTVAGYLVEGRRSRDFARTKALMYREPATWHALMEKLTEQFSRYVTAQARAGADVVQLFDSWVGVLSPADYAEFVEPYSARILAAVDVPTIHFGTGATEALLALIAVRAATSSASTGGCRSRGRAGGRAVQGNLEPAVLLGPWERIERETLASSPRARAAHVFNLGHGVLPGTDPDVLRRVVELVQLVTQATESACTDSVAREDP